MRVSPAARVIRRKPFSSRTGRDAVPADALRLGAKEFRLSCDQAIATDFAGAFDLILSTVPARIDYDAFLGMLALDGTMVLLGVPKEPITLDVFSLLLNRRSLAGTLVGGIAETQEMLDFCARHGIAAQVEVIDADAIDRAYDRIAAGEVRYRLVIDVRTMNDRAAGEALSVPPLPGTP